MSERHQKPAGLPGKVISFHQPPPRLRADVPPFDPTNPAHLRAWEAIFDFGQAELRRKDRQTEWSFTGHSAR